MRAEKGAVVKPRGGRTTVCLVYPNTYYVGMSSLGLQTVYRIINGRADALAERAFIPDEPDRQEFLKTGTPLFALESQSPVNSFDIVAFSVSFENDYAGVAEAMRLAKLPLYSESRGDGHPLVILGGIASFFNPEPLAPFFDAVIIGEAEEALPEFLDAYEAQKLTLSRDALLKQLAEIPGVYVPSLYSPSYKQDGAFEAFRTAPGAPERITRRRATDLDATPAHSVITTPNTEFGEMYMTEVSRGCGRHCRFCMAGYIYRPPRHRGLESVSEDILEGGRRTGRVGLVGAAVSDYPHISGLVERFSGMDIDFSASSLRADSLTPELARLIAKGNRSAAIAPEAGTERLRAVINKNITDEHVTGAVRMLIEAGILNVKLYFMVGLPTETETDIDGIVSLSQAARDEMVASAKAKGRLGRMTLSVNCFIPKPWTPFQWEAMEPADSLNGKLRRIKKALKGLPNLSVIHDTPKRAWLQAALSRGDRRLAPVIAAASENDGDWKAAFAASGLDMEFYAGRLRGKDELFPWDFLDTRIEKKYLMKEHARALEGKHTPPCKVGKCRTCGVC